MDLVDQIGLIANLLLEFALIVKLVRGRLHRIYLWFFIMLCFQALQSLGMIPSIGTRIYTSGPIC